MTNYGSLHYQYFQDKLCIGAQVSQTFFLNLKFYFKNKFVSQANSQFKCINILAFVSN